MFYYALVTPGMLSNIEGDGWLTHCGIVTLYVDKIWVEIASENGLLHAGTKPSY